MKNKNPLLISVRLLCPVLLIGQVAWAQGNLSRVVKPSRLRATHAAPAIVVGPNVQVSKAFPDRIHGEIHLATNPRNANNLVGGSMVGFPESNTQAVVAYASFDGGKTWSATLKLTDGMFHSDPAVGFDAEGTAYFLQITNTLGPEPKYYTYLHRSKDGGRTWLEPAIVPMLDRHYVAVDDNGGKYHGSLYVNGLSTRELSIQRSRNRGVSFDGEVRAAVAPSTRRNAGLARLVVLSDSTLVVPFLDTEMPIPDVEGIPTKPNAALKVVTSTDGGNTFSEPVTIAQTALGHLLTANPHHFSFTADHSAGAFKDRLYAAWTDSFSGGSQFSKKKSGGSNILFSYSADKGKTWSKPILVNDDRLPLNLADAPVHFQPVVAVNKDGVVGVMYYDRRDSANNLDWTVRFVASVDGGETFLPSVQVAESANHLTESAKLAINARVYGGGHMPLNTNYRGGTLKFDLNISQFNVGGGHTAGLDADANGVFHPFWIDNRTGVAQVWTAPVTIHRKAMLNGETELAALQDISEKVTLSFSNTDYDAKTGRLAVDVQMQNVSEDTIVLPVKIRVTILTCDSGGIATIIGADNGLKGVGAVWNFDKELVGQKLRPQQKSTVRRLEFNVAGMPQLSESSIQSRGWGALALLHVETKVLANIQRNGAAPVTEK